MTVFFEWDEAKNAANWRKHGIRFNEAVEAFNDPLHVSIADRIEGGEQRWQTFGVVGSVSLVMVANTVRDEDGDEIIRIISARYATRKERRWYEQNHD